MTSPETASTNGTSDAVTTPSTVPTKTKTVESQQPEEVENRVEENDENTPSQQTSQENSQKGQESAASAAENASVVAPTKTVFADPTNFNIKHPLQNRWTLWFDNPQGKANQQSWGDHLKKIMVFDTVEDFWRLFNNIVPSSKLLPGSNYHLFKEGVEPKWEDPYNARGGKWVVTIAPRQRKELLDKLWLWTVLAMIGESFEVNEEICGAVVSIRKSMDKIALWTKDSSNKDAQMSVGYHFKKSLEVPESTIVGYQAHKDCIRRNSSFNNKNRYQV